MGGMIWDEAALYCNWLSEREGIPEDQWCYEKNTGTHPEKFVTTMFLAGVALLVRLTGLFVKHKRLLQSCGWLCIAATLAIGSSAVYDWYCYEQVDRLVMKAKETFWELSGYRLPTEAEWEYACRAGASSSRYYGVSDSLLSRYAWNLSNGDDHMHPVARLKPNDYGLFDMMGNAHEWCIDGRFIYPAPSDKAVPDAPAVKSFRRRELRGGSYKNMPGYIRIANRANDRPDYRYSTFGFRVARTYPSSPSSSIP